MNIFHSIFLILSVVCEFSLSNITSISRSIIFENEDNTHKGIGESCIDKSNSNAGTCSLISDCPEIINRIQGGNNNHTVCSYQNLEQIVCCSSFANILNEESRKCFDPLSQSQYIEVIGETCTDEISGRQGKYRWSQQCPYHSNTRPKLEFSCCITVVCCPDLNIIPSSVPEQKCFDYGRSLFEGKWEIEGPYTARRTGNCPSFIFGGTFVSKGQFPFMAALGFQNKNGGVDYNCGGTLISDRYILTAGHCLSSPDLGPVVTVRLGAISLNETDFETHYFKDYSVIQRIPHPKYTRRFQYNDIALLLLDSPVEFSSFIRPACLPDSIEMTEFVTAMGWGMTEKGIQSQDLLQVDVKIFSHAQCNQSYGVNRKLNLGIVDETQVCAGSMDSNRDTCQGDSGGPLVSRHTRHYALHNLVGITSIGISCGHAGTPGVYTRVFPYVDWIQSIVWPNTV